MPVAATNITASASNNSVLSLRDRAIGKCQRLKLATRHSVQRIGLEAVLEGHDACVNCLDWNRNGSLLASGSDDGSVIVWNPFGSSPKHQVPTEHSRHIFSVKFVPQTCDQQVATSGGDSSVRVINLMDGQASFNCTSCHSDRVKRLDVHPNEPHTLLSAGEDGYIMQYDLRAPHTCSQSGHNSKPKNLLFDLKPSPGSLRSAKCIAMHPWKEELIAVGTDDILVRLLDRRYVQRSSKNPFIAHYAPGHLLKNPLNKPCQSFGTTYVAFSPNGRELLANYHAEQVYLFKLDEPTSPYRSFEAAIKPLILNKPSLNLNTKQKLDESEPLNPPIYKWDEIRKIDNSLPIPDKVKHNLHLLIEKIITNPPLDRLDLESLNEMLMKTKNIPDLYLMRSEAFIGRGWKGDYYQAILDCCSALILEPLNQCALSNITDASFSLNDKEAILGMIDILETLGADYKDQLDTARDLWERMLKDNSQTHITSSISIIAQSTSNSLDDLERVSRSNSTNSQDGSYNGEDIEEVYNIYATPFPDIKDFDLSHAQPFDFDKRFCGHCNMTTDIKEANFLGNNGEFIVAGSDDGAFYIWDKETTNLIKAVSGDSQVLNCLQPHPSICMLATSGVEPTVKLWSPKADKKYCHDVESIDARCTQNQNFINVDPLEAMIMMLYQSRDT